MANPFFSMRLCAIGLFTKCTIHVYLTDPSGDILKESLRALIGSIALFVSSLLPGGLGVVLARAAPGGG